MSYILDLILVALLVIFAIVGYRRGFVASILKSGRFFLAVILTIALTNPVATLLNDNFINPPIYDAVSGKLTDVADSVKGNASDFYEEIPAILQGQLDDKMSESEGDIDEAVEEWSQEISGKISWAVSKIIAVILLFVALMLLLSILVKILSAIVRATPLGGVDRILGLVLGLAVGVAMMLLVSRFVAPVLTAFGQGELVESSFLLDLLG